MSKIKDQIIELNQNFNDLGEDLLLLEAVVLTAQGENDFPRDYITSSLGHLVGCINQHTEDIRFYADLLQKETSPGREIP